MKHTFNQNFSTSKFLWNGGNKIKTATKIKVGLVAVVSVAAGVQASNIVAGQVEADTNANATFEVDVVESLSVSVTTDPSESTGLAGEFLRSPVELNVTASNAQGFTASMYANGSTSLTDGNNNTISTLSTNEIKSEFTANRWGYSLQNETTSNTAASTGDTQAGNDNSTYSPIVSDSTNPVTVMSRSTAATGSQKIWFGTKTDMTQAAGTYSGTVVLSVVTGNVTESTDTPNNNPITPTNPVTPAVDTPNDNTATYTGSTGTGATQGVGSSTVGGSVYTGTTAYTTRSGGTESVPAETTTTEVTGGDTRTSYAGPQGVITSTASSINSSTPLATGLAVTAGVAAASGLGFFILAKRKDDDDDE